MTLKVKVMGETRAHLWQEGHEEKRQNTLPFGVRVIGEKRPHLWQEENEEKRQKTMSFEVRLTGNTGVYWCSGLNG